MGETNVQNREISSAPSPNIATSNNIIVRNVIELSSESQDEERDTDDSTLTEGGVPQSSYKSSIPSQSDHNDGDYKPEAISVDDEDDGSPEVVIMTGPAISKKNVAKKQRIKVENDENKVCFIWFFSFFLQQIYDYFGYV